MESISQSELVERLSSIFPLFRAEWLADTENSFPSTSLHWVYQSLLPWVSSVELSAKQLKALALLLNAEVAAGGLRENAVGTCFLEHCRQVGLARRLSPLLSAAAKSRLHA